MTPDRDFLAHCDKCGQDMVFTVTTAEKLATPIDAHAALGRSGATDPATGPIVEGFPEVMRVCPANEPFRHIFGNRPTPVEEDTP